MLILGIDTSCDDTSAAVVEAGRIIRSNIISGQSEIHARYGGIVPELASRRHIEMILPVVHEALGQAAATFRDLAAIAVCQGPGLVGSLLVGCSFAKALGFARKIPIVAVNHLEGHILTPFLSEHPPEFPFLALVVSGGHTSLYLAEDFGRYTELGRTRDDAAGEAYDKIAKLLGLGYPGGPAIDRLAARGNAAAISFPRAYVPDSLDFSFSGLKTAVLNYLRSSGDKPRHTIEDVAASFQAAVVDVLVRKTEWAMKSKRLGRVVLSGGVSANAGLRTSIARMGARSGADIWVPAAELCTDNAAMIAAAGYHRALKGEFAGLDLNAQAYLRL